MAIDYYGKNSLTTGVRPVVKPSVAPQQPAPAPPPAAPPAPRPYSFVSGIQNALSTGVAASKAATTPTSYSGPSGLLNSPGIGEQWWQQNQYRYNQPTQSQQYWNGIQGYFNTPYTPDVARNAYSQYGANMGQQFQGTRNAYNTSQSLLGNQGWGETTGQSALNYFGNTGSGETYINGLLGSGYFDRAGAGENFYNQNQQFFQTPGFGENWIGSNIGALEKSGVAEGNYGNAQNALRRINYGDQALNATNRGLLDSNNALNYYRNNGAFAFGQPETQQELNFFRPDLRNKSYSEQMFESGSGGLIDPYQRAQDKQMRVIRNAAAARGQFNSGASLRLEEELAADTAANEARDRIALGNQADQQRLARIGAAQGFAGAADTAELGRRMFGLNASTAADESQRANLNTGLNAYGLASGEALKKVGLETEAADIAQRNMLDRYFKAGNLALGSQEAGLSRMKTGGDFAFQAQNANLDRTMRGVDTARTGQELGMTRMNDYFNTGKGMQELAENRMLSGAKLGMTADEAERQRINDLFLGGLKMNDAELGARNSNLDMYRTGAQITQGIDNYDLNKLNSEREGAYGAQGLFENRELGGLNAISSNAKAQFDAVLNQLDAATKADIEMQFKAIMQQAEKEHWSAEQTNQAVANLYQTAATIMKSRQSPGGGAPA